jgi:hypothetical protein
VLSEIFALMQSKTMLLINFGYSDWNRRTRSWQNRPARRPSPNHARSGALSSDDAHQQWYYGRVYDLGVNIHTNLNNPVEKLIVEMKSRGYKLATIKDHPHAG